MILEKKSNAVEAVSYKHLDVYKRQLEGLASLRPSFRKDGTVTAGNASGLNDGAAALLLASEKAIKEHNLAPVSYTHLDVYKRQVLAMNAILFDMLHFIVRFHFTIIVAALVCFESVHV